MLSSPRFAIDGYRPCDSPKTIPVRHRISYAGLAFSLAESAAFRYKQGFCGTSCEGEHRTTRSVHLKRLALRSPFSRPMMFRTRTLNHTQCSGRNIPFAFCRSSSKGPPYNRLSQNESAKRPQAKTSIWAGATRVFVRFCRPKVLTGSLPPKSPIGNRQGPSGAPKAKNFILPEMFFRLLAH